MRWSIRHGFMPSQTMAERWLKIVGIGEDGVAGLGETARRLIAEAEIVYGGARHLALVEGLGAGERRAWPSPFDTVFAEIVALRGRNVCVLASGDPFFYGVGASLSRHVGADEMMVVPAPSAFALAAARMGWPLQDVAQVSLHGRPIALIVPHLHDGRKILALTSDGDGPAALAALLAEKGFGESVVTVLEAMGGPRERVRSARAAAFDMGEIDALNVCAVSVVASAGARVIALAPGLPDACFSHDGQITKREVRALTLSALAPRHGALLWDIGAGSGSVGIEWMLGDISLKAIAIEADGLRVERARANARALGVPGLVVIEGRAPDALTGLDAPDAVFVGGGGSDPGVMDAAMAALKPGGRLVANGVTLEMEAVLLALRATHGGSLTRIALSRAEPIGAMTGWRPAMPITQWVWDKPGDGR
jgi:precorrin-6B C5,15-methyltransferase / cobalt-precorrin-6B C5,C15-methyltransferase